MSAVACIVEGHGEVQAMPVLLRRLLERREAYGVRLSVPIRVARDRFLRRDDELSRMIALAALNAGPGGLVLVVLDADDDCPVALAADVLQRARPYLREASCQVVIANREFESWLLAGASSLSGKRGLPEPLEPPSDCEAIRDVRGWLADKVSSHCGGTYSPVADQAALTAVLDIEAAVQASRSLRKLDKTVEEFVSGLIRG